MRPHRVLGLLLFAGPLLARAGGWEGPVEGVALRAACEATDPGPAQAIVMHALEELPRLEAIAFVSDRCPAGLLPEEERLAWDASLPARIIDVVAALGFVIVGAYTGAGLIQWSTHVAGLSEGAGLIVGLIAGAAASTAWEIRGDLALARTSAVLAGAGLGFLHGTALREFGLSGEPAQMLGLAVGLTLGLLDATLATPTTAQVLFRAYAGATAGLFGLFLPLLIEPLIAEPKELQGVAIVSMLIVGDLGYLAGARLAQILPLTAGDVLVLTLGTAAGTAIGALAGFLMMFGGLFDAALAAGWLGGTALGLGVSALVVAGGHEREAARVRGIEAARAAFRPSLSVAPAPSGGGPVVLAFDWP